MGRVPAQPRQRRACHPHRQRVGVLFDHLGQRRDGQSRIADHVQQRDRGRGPFACARMTKSQKQQIQRDTPIRAVVERCGHLVHHGLPRRGLRRDRGLVARGEGIERRQHGMAFDKARHFVGQAEGAAGPRIGQIEEVAFGPQIGQQRIVFAISVEHTQNQQQCLPRGPAPRIARHRFARRCGFADRNLVHAPSAACRQRDHITKIGPPLRRRGRSSWSGCG